MCQIPLDNGRVGDIDAVSVGYVGEALLLLAQGGQVGEVPLDDGRVGDIHRAVEVDVAEHKVIARRQPGHDDVVERELAAGGLLGGVAARYGRHRHRYQPQREGLAVRQLRRQGGAVKVGGQQLAVIGGDGEGRALDIGEGRAVDGGLQLPACGRAVRSRQIHRQGKRLVSRGGDIHADIGGAPEVLAARRHDRHDLGAASVILGSAPLERATALAVDRQRQGALAHGRLVSVRGAVFGELLARGLAGGIEHPRRDRVRKIERGTVDGLLCLGLYLGLGFRGELCRHIAVDILCRQPCGARVQPVCHIRELAVKGVLVIGVGAAVRERHVGHPSVVVIGVVGGVHPHRAVVGDPRGIRVQIPDAVVHLGSTREDRAVHICRVQRRAVDPGRVQRIADRREEVLEPRALDISEHIGVLDGGREEVRTDISALERREPSRRLGIVGDAQPVELIVGAAGVAERVVIIPYGRSKEPVVPLAVGLVGQKERRRARVPVLAELVDEVDARERLDIDIAVKVAVAARQRVDHQRVLHADIVLHGGVVLVRGRELGRLDRQVVAVANGEVKVIVGGRRVDLAHKAEVVLHPAGRLVQIVVLFKIVDQAVLADIDLLAQLVAALILAVGIEVDKPRVGGIRDADRIGQIEQQPVARQGCILEVGDQRELLARGHAGK